MTKSSYVIVGDDVRSLLSLGLLPKPALSWNVLIRDSLRRLLQSQIGALIADSVTDRVPAPAQQSRTTGLRFLQKACRYFG